MGVVEPWGHDAQVFIDGLREIIDTRLLHCANGDELPVAAGGAGQQCFLVIRGCVEDWHTAEDGRYTIGHVYQPGHVIIPGNTPGGTWDDLSHISIGKSVIGVMEARAFWHLLKEKPELTHLLIKQIFNDLGRAMSRLVDNNLVSVTERIRRELLRRFEAADNQRGNRIWIKSHEQFAAYMGVNRETVSRELSALARGGAIETSRGVVTILNAARLK